MQGPHQLLESEDHWVTEMGAWFPGERVVFRGKDLFHELNGMPWMGLLLYGITGRILDEKQIRLFEGMWSLCTSYPDPRLWNNRVAALAGTARSTATLGISAATAVSEAIIYGHRPLMAAMDFLLRIKDRVDSNSLLETAIETELHKAKSISGGKSGHGKRRAVASIPGYGRPITFRDERILPLMRLAEQLGYTDGVLVRIAFAVEDALKKKGSDLRMNIAALMAGLAADAGFTPKQFYHYCSLCFSAGFTACSIDALTKTEGTLFPLRCEKIIYEGQPHRIWQN